MLSEQLRNIIENDIKEYEKDGQFYSEESFQRLITKYDEIFPGFESKIHRQAIVLSIDGSSSKVDYHFEVNQILERLKAILVQENSSDCYYLLKKQIDEDILKIGQILLKDIRNDIEIQSYYIYLVTRYNECIPNFAKGMKWYDLSSGIFNIPTGNDMYYNLMVIKTKLEIFQQKGYPFILENKESPSLVIENNIANTNNNNISITFDDVRKQIDNMTALSDKEINEIKKRIDELEEISNSKDSKKTKWERIKPKLLWLGDKGVDVAIQLLPLYIQTLI